MLVQSASKIIKADFSVWKKKESCVVNTMVSEQENLSNLRNVVEIVLDEGGSYHFTHQLDSSVLVIVLYGEILINDFKKPITSEQVFTVQSKESGFLTVKNNLADEKADILILELKSKRPDHFFSVEDVNIRDKNTLIPISNQLEYPNFIGLYEGRQEQEYSLYHPKNTLFGLVLNGAFEFQNMLLETRDCVIIKEIETLEFEALSENALLLFLEV
ncbi:hypothetical protein IW15_14750 [Chryseobacterium soli]|uniref:Quercetin 2,3-dioxygenase C-terminal cupin domain-containing protein n=1 Tax=Chryseobacterium soli TaxID=445961 RepID=A0A086A5H4_9FLAO|nr:hypothetical protein [Chryseobacterium soli]KFF11938.1 hypothetical protein IW15_14750 [Chryseobacterium soli]